jgi:ubiquinone/menaquinone biosynthesis C-methylase UbiE
MLSKTFWEKYFTVYDSLNELIPYQQLLQTILVELELFPKAIVLDAGAGSGNLSLEIKNAEAFPIGLDSSDVGLKIYKEKIPDGSVLNADLLDKLPFPDNFFDRIVSNNTLYTISRLKRPYVISEFYRVLKPRGIVVISDLNTSFKPLHIFLSHISFSFNKVGLLKTVATLVNFFVPTVKIFYYNYRIKREAVIGAYDFFYENEQAQLLENAQFKVLKQSYKVYSGCGYLAKATKEA